MKRLFYIGCLLILPVAFALALPKQTLWDMKKVIANRGGGVVTNTTFATWTTNPATAFFTGAAMDYDASVIMVCGNEGSSSNGTWRSLDNGVTFQRTDSSFHPTFIDVSACGVTQVCAERTSGAAGGEVFYSTDTGTTWSAITPDVGATDWFGQCHITADGGTIQLIPVSGTEVYRSTDGGSTWSTQTIASGSHFWGCMSKDGVVIQTGVYGGQSQLSTNSGSTFVTNHVSANWYGYGASEDGKYLSKVVNGGALYSSSNTGQTWSTGVAGGRAWVAGKPVCDDGRIQMYAVTGNKAWFSTDFGATWAEKGDAHSAWGCAISGDGRTRLITIAANTTGIRINTD